MSEQPDSNQPNDDENDGLNDAFAAAGIIVVVVGAVVFWLSGMPS